MTERTDTERETGAPIQVGICPRCDYVMYPVLPMLPCGHSEAPRTVSAEEPGTVYSWTRIPSGDTTTLLAMVDLYDGRLRVSGPVEQGQSVGIGDLVRAVEGPASIVFWTC